MIRGFVEVLGNAGPDRLVKLNRDQIVEGYYVMVGPDREAGFANIKVWREYDVPKWGWYVCTAEQEVDVEEIVRLDAELDPIGWCLNIEKPLEGAKLEVLLAGVSALGKPIVGSLAAYNASMMEYDYRALDRHKVAIDWQAYFDSGEGTDPHSAVSELFQSSFVIPNWEYRTVMSGKYGWGKIVRIEAGQRALIDLYQRPGPVNAYVAVTPREGWGWKVVSRTLWAGTLANGTLMGRAAYPNIRVTLDVTRTASSRPANEWTTIAANARAAGASRRPCSVYLIERTTDDVIRAIAAGSG